MAKQAKTALYSVAAVVVGTGIFFLATNKGRLFKKSKAGIKALFGGAPAEPEAAPAPSSPAFKSRTPAPANGHVRDVAASNPPPPDSGSNFTPQGNVHGPQ